MARQQATIWGTFRCPNGAKMELAIATLNAFLVKNGADSLPNDGDDERVVFATEDDGAERVTLNLDVTVHDYDRHDLQLLETGLSDLVSEPSYLTLDNYDTGDSESRRTPILLGNPVEARILFAVSELEECISMSADARARIIEVLRADSNRTDQTVATETAETLGLDSDGLRLCREFVASAPNARLFRGYYGCGDEGAAEDVVASEGAPRSVVDAFEDLTDAIFASRDWGVDDNAGGQVEVTMTAAGCRIVVECPETELVVTEVIDVV